MVELTLPKQKFLLQLARQTIEGKLGAGEPPKVDESSLDDILKIRRATFVTITKDKELRGCIGKLLPVVSLYKDVMENAICAAFSDPRFPPLTKEELSDIKIEISVLTLPKKLDYTDSHDLARKLDGTRPGVTIRHGLQGATFLPQVWEELPKADDFLSHLCMKAGLFSNTWRNEHLEVQTYNVFKFCED